MTDSENGASSTPATPATSPATVTEQSREARELFRLAARNILRRLALLDRMCIEEGLTSTTHANLVAVEVSEIEQLLEATRTYRTRLEELGVKSE